MAQLVHDFHLKKRNRITMFSVLRCSPSSDTCFVADVVGTSVRTICTNRNKTELQMGAQIWRLLARSLQFIFCSISLIIHYNWNAHRIYYNQTYFPSCGYNLVSLHHFYREQYFSSNSFSNCRFKLFTHDDLILSVVWSAYYGAKLTDDTKSRLANNSPFTRRLKQLNTKNDEIN